MQVIKAADLHYKGGGSDKVYHVVLVDNGATWEVRTAYGRRGSTLVVNTLAGSQKACEVKYYKLTNEKVDKGYRPAPGISGDVFGAGSKFVAKGVYEEVAGLYTEEEDRLVSKKSIHMPQLLNVIDEMKALELIKDDAWVMQEKFDGRRLAILSDKQHVQGINKKGQLIEPMSELVAEVVWDAGSYLIDGEAIGSTLYAFDLLEEEGTDLRKKGYTHRLKRLMTLLTHSDFTKIVGVPTAITTAEKKALLQKVKDDGGEGIVFKHAHAVYEPGRPNSGGNQLKFKFWAQETFKVMNDNGTTRSVFLGAYDVVQATWIDVGKVTIPANHEMPPAGSFVEVRYLYYYPGGSLYQPQYEGQRDDCDEFDCDIKKLKIKQGEEDDA